MRYTEEQRFRSRIKVIVPWFYKRCNSCGDDVKREKMYFMKSYGFVRAGMRTYYNYLCRTCAPSFDRAAELWENIDH